MFEIPSALAQLAAPWARYYSHSTAAPIVVLFLHLAPLVVGGGLAITIDRGTLQQRAAAATGSGQPSFDPQGLESRARRRHLRQLASAHRVVLGSLVLMVASGVALLASDLETFWPSWIFWLKMGLVLLLLANGAVMARVVAPLERDTGDVEGAWRSLRRSARASIALWLLIILAGVALTSAA